MKVFKIFSVILIFFIMVGTLSSFYAVNIGENSSKLGINVNNSTSKVIYVAKNGTDRNNGLTVQKPKRNIQNAIKVASPGDTIRVAPGTYFDTPITVDRNVTIIGSSKNSTIIDGNCSTLCVSILSGVKVTLTNFTITRGYTWYHGGGILNAGTLTIKNVDITNNVADRIGGGIENTGKIIGDGLTIRGNYACWGGGIYNDNETELTNSTISNNRAQYGGGIYSRNLLTVEDSSITSNSASTNDATGGIDGVGIAYLYGVHITFNTGGFCGGIGGIKTYADDLTVIKDNHPKDVDYKVTPA